MGARGPAPKPTALKRLQGNPGKGKLPTNEPKSPPMLAATDPPPWLPETARAFWTELSPMLTAMRLIAAKDLPALVLLCDAWAEWRSAREVVLRDGASYAAVTETGIIVRKRPEVAIAADSWRRLKLMLAEFGLTPASGGKVAALGDDIGDADPAESWLMVHQLRLPGFASPTLSGAGGGSATLSRAQRDT